MGSPTTLTTKLDRLASALAGATIAVADFETSGLRPHMDQAAGLGVYLPKSGQAFYINVGHGLDDAQYPRYAVSELADVLRPFLGDPSRHLIMHNATFDLRWLLGMGLTIRCRVSCSLVHTHRVDENLHEKAKERTTHYHTTVSYGLKELTAIYFNERAPTLHGVIGAVNVIQAPIHNVATYCVLDCYNTWRLYERANAILAKDGALLKLTRDIDDPNLLVLAKMMGEGILIDTAEVIQQITTYERAIQACRDHIWQATGLSCGLDTPREMLRVLRHLQLGDDLQYDPFYLPLHEGESDPSVKRDILVEVFDGCENTNKRLVVALFIAKTIMEQRLSSFLRPLPERVRLTEGRLYPDRFSSTLVTTRFSSSPNLQNLPRKMGEHDDVDEDEVWRSMLPPECSDFHTTKDIFIARPGHQLVCMDLSAAEPRYLALLFQRAIKEKDGYYKAKRQELRQLRRDKYPHLVELMHATAKPYEPQDNPDSEIQWPKYDEDPLYRVFKYGDPFPDPYNALLAAMDRETYETAKRENRVEKWLEDERWRGKRAFLALGYGSSAQNLYKPLKWTLERTEKAIADLEGNYATLMPLRELTLREMIHTGEVRSLWGRPRRINGYYQLAHPEPVTVSFYRMRPVFQKYEADIIPLGSTRQAVQAFVKRCYICSEDGKTGELVLESDPVTGNVLHKSRGDVFVNADHFNRVPFRNINFSQIRWVRDGNGLTRQLPRQERAKRQAFNALCQSTGADHLRWLMNRMDQEVCARPEFADCKLVLTIHDSLLFEVPNDKVQAFIEVARPIMQCAPPWCDIPIKVGIEVGARYGAMKKVKAPVPIIEANTAIERQGCLYRMLQPWSWLRR